MIKYLHKVRNINTKYSSSYIPQMSITKYFRMQYKNALLDYKLCLFLCRQWNGSIHRHRVYSVGVRHTDGDIWLGATIDERLQDWGIVCRPFWVAGARVDEAYTQRMMGEGKISKDWQWKRYYYRIVGRIWKRGHWWRTAKTSTERLKGGWYQR